MQMVIMEIQRWSEKHDRSCGRMRRCGNLEQEGTKVGASDQFAGELVLVHKTQQFLDDNIIFWIQTTQYNVGRLNREMR